MEQYDKKYFADLEKSEKVELPRNLRVLRAIESFKKSGRLLDVGIGTGLLLKLAKGRGWNVQGTDVSSYAIGKAKKYGFEIFKGRLEESTFKDIFFDVVNMRHSLEHMEDPSKALVRAYQILKPGGIICITTPNSFGAHAKIFGKDWPHLSLPYHLHFFSKQSLSRLVEDAGFVILQLKTEELTIYDIFKLFLFKIGLPVKYQNPSWLTFFVNNLLASVGLGEGLLLIAKKT